VIALRRRTVATREVAARVRLTKTPEQYLATRSSRRELTYEAVLGSGSTSWIVGDHIRVYRAVRGRAALLRDDEDLGEGDDGGAGLTEVDRARDPRDYDVDFYVRVLRETFAARLARALTPEDFATVFADPQQPSLFGSSLAQARPILTVLDDPLRAPAS
jgi:hypothetical protein